MKGKQKFEPLEKLKRKFDVKRLYPNVTLPKKDSKRSPGYNRYSYIQTDHPTHPGIKVERRQMGLFLEPGDKVVIPTGCVFSIHPDYYGRVEGKPTHSWGDHLDVCGGIMGPGLLEEYHVDLEYRGEVFVVVENNRKEKMFIPHDSCVGQIIFEKFPQRDFEGPEA